MSLFPIPSLAAPELSVRHCGTTSAKKSKIRSRPNLSKVCAKTKMCSYFLRGACTRDADCCFAHDPSEIQAKPDLSGTKMCPALLKTGHCSRVGCTFAHSEQELRRIDTESKTQPEASPSLEVQRPLSPMPEPRNKLVSRLNAATISGALTLSEMVMHLTNIFSAIFENRPEVASRVGLAPSALALATAEGVWGDARLSPDSRMSFGEFTSWCKLPFVETVPLTSEALMMKDKIAGCKGSSTVSTADSDASSQCSTEEGSSSIFSPIQSASGWETPTGSEYSPSRDWCDQDPPVLNTFIHFVDRDVSATRRRASSVPVGRR